MTDVTFSTLSVADTATAVWEFKKFHNTIFPNTAASREWLKWYIDLGRSIHGIGTRVYVARRDSDNAIVGSWCVEPKLFRNNDKINFVGRCFAVGIHPDMRRQNLFVRLSKFAIESEKNRGEYAAILGFPQLGRPVIAAHLKSGWQELSKIDMLSARPENHDFPLSMVRMHNFEEIDTNVEDVFEASKKSTMFIETPRYFRSRWLQHPDNSYIVLGTKETPHSTIVLKQYGSIMHVLSIRGRVHDATFLLGAASTLAYRHRCTEINAWGHANDLYRPALMKSGFTENSSESPSIQMMHVNLKPDHFHGIGTETLGSCVLHQGIEEIY